MSIYAKEVNQYLIAIKRGDKSSFKPLFDLIGGHVAGVARYYLDDKSYCDDVTAEVFQKIFLYINSYDERNDGYNWICRIAQNIAYNYNEKAAKDIQITSIAAASGIAEPDKNTEEKLDLFRAIDNLEPESRELIYQYFYLGKSFKEIADNLHLSKAGVKKRIDKILSTLKIFIEHGKR